MYQFKAVDEKEMVICCFTSGDIYNEKLLYLPILEAFSGLKISSAK